MMILEFLAQKATRVFLVALAVGILVPPLASLFKPVLSGAVWLVLCLSMLRTDWQALAIYFRRPAYLIAGILFILVVSPLLMWGVVSISVLTPGLMAALILMAAAPPITASSALGYLLNLDGGFNLLLLIICTLLLPLSLPVMAISVAGVELSVDETAMATRLAILVCSAAVVAVLLRKAIGPARIMHQAKRIDGAVVVILIVFAIGLVDGVTYRFLEQPLRVGLIIGLSFIANLGLQICAVVMFLPFGKVRALTVALAAGSCNMALVLAVLPADADADIPLYFALAQIPIFTLPALLTPVYRMLLGKE
jgi:bile acid:Na+ symporter, BASS family